MKRSHTSASAAKPAGTPRGLGQPRGSILLFAMVMLVLLTVMGAAYIQVARVDRISTLQMSQNYIDQVVDASVAEIQKKLKDDLFDSAGRMFNTSTSDSGAKDEALDYPWTNTVNNAANNFTVTLLTGATATARGGLYDDMHLAASAPDFTTPAAPVWTHITNMNGIFLKLPKSTASAANKLPAEDVLDHSSVIKSDTNIVITNGLPPNSLGTALDETASVAEFEKYGTDADGDGIDDARWTWAPIKQFGSTMYVMAVRIIDNSAMLNANVATILTDSGGNLNNVLGDAPRWTYPTELDMGALEQAFRSSTNETKQLLEYRVGGAIGLPLQFSAGAALERFNYWRNGPRVYGKFNSSNVGVVTAYKSLSAADELELRRGNGLASATSSVPIVSATQGMPTLLRHGTAETDYTSPNYTSYTLPSTGNARQDFFQREPRKMLTVFSGASLFAPRLPNLGVAVVHNGAALSDDGNVVRKVDINAAVANPANLSAEIRKVIERGTFPLPPSCANKEQFANQFAANIKDYIDNDNEITRVAGSAVANDGYGMEALPMLTEVYVQAKYNATTITPGAPNDTVTWTKDGTAGIAIEIRNPFPRRIELSKVHLFVGATDLGELSSGSLANKPTMDPNEVIVLYANSAPGTAGAEDNVNTLIDTTVAGYTYTLKTITAPATLGDVELRATITGAGLATWPYSKIPLTDLTGPTVDLPAPSGTIAVSAASYWQKGMLGNGLGLNMVSILPNVGGAVNQIALLEKRPDAVLFDAATREGLGLADKTSVGGPAGALSAAALQRSQVLIADQNITQIAELGQIAIFGPAPGRTVSEAWSLVGTAAGATGSNGSDDDADGTADNIEESDPRVLMLNFRATNHIDTTIPSLDLTHGELMLDRFTAYEPLTDNADNDGDGQDTLPAGAPDGITDTNKDSTDPEDNEHFIPGLLNVNTATPEVLSRCLPIPDAAKRATLVTAITEYRKAPTRAGGTKGIASLSELYHRQAGTGTRLADLFVDAVDNDVAGAAPTRIDFLGQDLTTSDGVADDREEQILPLLWLSQVASTRSDVYTAYVEIRGYPSQDFRKPLTEQARFIAVFERGSVKDKNSPVKVLAFLRLQ